MRSIGILLSLCITRAITSFTHPTAFSKHAFPMNMGLDDADDAEILPLSESDIARLSDIRSRCTTIPIMILDSMLPGQCLQLGSPDPKFRKLVEYVLDGDEGYIGMIGTNPYTGRPLNMGVTVPLSSQNIKLQENMVSISIQGEKRFEVQGEPWLDQTESFYLADIEIVENRVEHMDANELKEAKELSDLLPDLVQEWLSWVIKVGKSDDDGMARRMKDIGRMPGKVGKRAIWVAALINPLPALGVCLEIRPAMLACKTDLDRIKLAVTAITSSIDHLSGKKKLF